jgi:hypothetical protein
MNVAAHINSDQLPSECKCLLTIATMAASLRAGIRRRQSNEALASVSRSFWNESRLAPSDLGNLSQISNQLCIWITSTRTTQN